MRSPIGLLVMFDEKADSMVLVNNGERAKKET
jgi:hypothetical protein